MASTATMRRSPGQAVVRSAAPGSSAASATNTRRRTSRPCRSSQVSEQGHRPPPTVKARASNQSRTAACRPRRLPLSAIGWSAPRPVIASAVVGWQEAASRLTSAPRRSSPASRSGSTAGSPPLSATRRCARTRPLLVAKALTRCSGVLPRRRSKDRRSALPSTAICGGAPSSSRSSSPATTNARRVQARKPCSNSPGSISISTRRNGSCEGMPPGSSRKRPSQARLERP